MDRLSGLDARRVLQALSSSLDKERRLWKPTLSTAAFTGEISAEQRDEAAVWITRLAAEFKFLPETCGLAIVLMDRVMQLVKIRAKYLQCVAVTCLYLAAKTLEEDENIPSTPEIVRKSHCGCSFSEITRMEIVILSKLNWEIRLPSPVDFLHTLHVVLLMHYPHLLTGASGSPSPSEQLSVLMRQMLRCLTSHTLLGFRPSTMALTLLSLHLEELTPGWLRLVLALQRMTNVGSEQLMQCREAMAEFLGHQLLPGYVGRHRLSSSSAPKSKKRKVEHSSSSFESAVDDDNMYEGIKRLYNEESFAAPQGTASACGLRTSCGMEMQHQDLDENTVPIGLSALMVN